MIREGDGDAGGVFGTSGRVVPCEGPLERVACLVGPAGPPGGHAEELEVIGRERSLPVGSRQRVDALVPCVASHRVPAELECGDHVAPRLAPSVSPSEDPGSIIRDGARASVSPRREPVQASLWIPRSSVSLMASPRRTTPTGTLTFLFSDIEGSTRLVESLGTATYRELLEQHQRLLRSAFAAAGGIRAIDRGRLVLRRLPRRSVGRCRRGRGAARPRGRDLAGWRAGARQDGPPHRPRRRRRRRLCRPRRPPSRADRRSGPRRPGPRLGVDPRPRPVSATGRTSSWWISASTGSAVSQGPSVSINSRSPDCRRPSRRRGPSPSPRPISRRV